MGEHSDSILLKYRKDETIPISQEFFDALDDLKE